MHKISSLASQQPTKWPERSLFHNNNNNCTLYGMMAWYNKSILQKTHSGHHVSRPYGTQHLRSITCGGAARHHGIAPHSGEVYSTQGKHGLRHRAHIRHSVDGCFGDRAMKRSQHSRQLITFINYLPTGALFCRGVVRRLVIPRPLSTQGCSIDHGRQEEKLLLICLVFPEVLWTRQWVGNYEEPWSRGRAPDCQSRGRWFNPTYRHFEIHIVCVFRKRH